MNKKLLTIAMAAAMVAPLVATADTTVYGKINTAIMNVDDGTNDAWGVENGYAGSRLGFKGTEDLGNGMKAFFQYEFKADGQSDGGLSSGGRLANVGLTGGFGTVVLGQVWSPYYNTVDVTDIMDLSPTENKYFMGPGRINNVAAYITPNFSGLTATAGVIMDIESMEDGADIYNISVDYANGPLTAGVSYLSYEATNEDQWGLGLKYKMDMFAVMAQYEDNNDADADSWALGGEAYFGNNTVKAVYGSKSVGSADLDAWSIGVKHNFSKRTFVYAGYESQSPDGGDDHDTFGLGLQHNF
jgi:predicted porin